MTPKVIYVAHPLGQGPDREENRVSATCYCAAIAELGGGGLFVPVADWIILTGVWDETKRDLGLFCDKALIARSDQLWLVGPRFSPGMRDEAEHALLLGKPVYDFTHRGPGELHVRINFDAGTPHTMRVTLALLRKLATWQ